MRPTRRLAASGRYGSASEVVRPGLRPVGEEEAELKWRRDRIQASIAGGGDFGIEDIPASVHGLTRELQGRQRT